MTNAVFPARIWLTNILEGTIGSVRPWLGPRRPSCFGRAKEADLQVGVMAVRSSEKKNPGW